MSNREVTPLVEARVKHLLREVVDLSKDGSEELLSVSEYYGVAPRSKVLDVGEHLSRAESLEGYKKCAAGDLVMNIMLAWKRALGVSEFNGIVSPAYAVFRPELSLLNPRFAHHFFRSDVLISEFKKLSTGVIDSRLRLYPEVFGSMTVKIPQLTNQERIANFLDDKTARIDALIAEKEQLSELLNDAKNGEVSRLVTGGYQVSSNQTDSSIPWLPRYPAHWQLASLKYIVDVRDGTHETPVYVTDSDDAFPLVTSKDVSSGCLLFEDAKHISREDYESIARRSGVSRGDLLMPMIGTVGGAVEVDSDRKFAIKNLALFRTSASSCNTKWLQAVLNSQYVKTQFEFLRSGGVQGFIGLGELRGLRVPVPPLKEQQEIANRVASTFLRYMPLVSHVQEHITRLREYRSSLISAAVTGQLNIESHKEVA